MGAKPCLDCGSMGHGRCVRPHEGPVAGDGMDREAVRRRAEAATAEQGDAQFALAALVASAEVGEGLVDAIFGDTWTDPGAGGHPDWHHRIPRWQATLAARLVLAALGGTENNDERGDE